MEDRPDNDDDHIRPLDNDPWFIRCRDTLFDLWTVEEMGRVHPSFRGRTLPFGYDPAATCPVWQGLMMTSMPDAGVRQYFQKFVGLCLTGTNTPRIILLRGGHGKTTILNTLRSLLGDYATPISPDGLFGADPLAADDTPALADLEGVRLVTADGCRQEDLARGGELALTTLVSDREPLRVRRLYQNRFTLRPTAKIILSTNGWHTNLQDRPLQRYVRTITLPHFIGEDGRRRGLAEILHEEVPGIFNWALDGLRAFHAAREEYDDGLAPEPDAVMPH